MTTETTVEIASYRLPVVIERVNGSYQATSPALDGFLVLADTLDEVLPLAPGVARALHRPRPALRHKPVPRVLSAVGSATTGHQPGGRVKQLCPADVSDYGPLRAGGGATQTTLNYRTSALIPLVRSCSSVEFVLH